MMKIAYLASKATLPGSPTRRSDAFEHDRMMDALRDPFAEKAMQVVDVDWADQTQDWSSYGAVIVGTTWDYWDHHAQFLRTLQQIEQETLLFNSAALIQWNSHKGYLRALEQKGARLIPTIWIDEVTPARAADAFSELCSDDLVFKRQVGAGADGQYRLSSTSPLPDMPHAMMVQPFLSKIQEEGEYSFIFIDGQFCHALLKTAKTGDYRIQSTYGGQETPVTPSSSDLQDAVTVLQTLDETPLYARVDMLRGDDDRLLLMELELVEPYLYPLEGPQLGPTMAAAVTRRMSE
ncbi:MAG: hypothetical protein AAGJ51_02215 [Pseudomonadota bacterium]